MSEELSNEEINDLIDFLDKNFSKEEESDIIDKILSKEEFSLTPIDVSTLKDTKLLRTIPKNIFNARKVKEILGDERPSKKQKLKFKSRRKHKSTIRRKGKTRTEIHNLMKSLKITKSPKIKLNRLIRLKKSSRNKSTRNKYQKEINAIRKSIKKSRRKN